MKSTMQIESLKNDNQLQKKNIMESQIFMDNNDLLRSKKGKNKSIAPFSGMSLKGSIMPFGNCGAIEEVNEESNGNSNGTSIKASNNDDNNEGENPMKELGGSYMGDDNDNEVIEETPKEEKSSKNNKKKNIKKSALLGMSINNNLFDINNQFEDNVVGELKLEINDLYKKRDKMEDELNLKDEKLKKSLLDNQELKNKLEEMSKQMEDLKKSKL